MRSLLLNTLILCSFLQVSYSLVSIDETASRIDITNERLHFAVNKSNGFLDVLTLDSVDLLGSKLLEEPIPGGPTGNGESGIGPYLDCYCVLEGNGNYSPGSNNASYRVVKDTQNAWAGVVMSDTHLKSGQLMQQYWFLKTGETGIHTFSRVAYPKEPKGPTRKLLQEFRTLFRPNTPLWTHMSTNDELGAPLPKRENLRKAKTVQDATWDLGPSKSDAYVAKFSKYFTKYTFADTWRDHAVHGMFGDGAGNPKGVNGTWGVWLVMNSRDSYYGGPLHSDLTVDENVYNYMVSNHHGANVPELKPGFDRTFGPTYYHFNHLATGTSLRDSRKEATRYADPIWNNNFYSEIAQHITGYTGPSSRSTFTQEFIIPPNIKNAIAILSANGTDFQDNARRPNDAQYWGPVSPNGTVSIPNVIAGTYRLTLQASNIFGSHIRDSITIPSSHSNPIPWHPESHGTELWRIGTPDMSAGEFRHGYARDETHSLKPQEYRIYWGAYDFPRDFPYGVRFRVGKSREARDWNYVHWSEFKGQRGAKIRDWRILWSNGSGGNGTVAGVAGEKATFTVQLAAAKTLSGNAHVPDEDGKTWPDLVFEVIVNGIALEPWRIPYQHSSNCAVRSGISCYNTAHKFVFDAGILRPENEIVLRLPSEGGQVYVQYDALRLEVG